MDQRQRIEIRLLDLRDLTSGFLLRFERRQIVENVVRGAPGNTVTVKEPFTDDWTVSDRQAIEDELIRIALNDGIVVGAIAGEEIVGFAAIDPLKIGPHNQYCQLKELHVCRPMRAKGIGTQLFLKCSELARVKNIEKLYISSHSALETVSFYKNQGCVDAAWMYPEQVQKEPFDYQFEYKL